MRAFTCFILLATFAAPTLAAQDGNRSGGRFHRGQSSEQSNSTSGPRQRGEQQPEKAQRPPEQRFFGGQRSEAAQANLQGSSEQAGRHHQEQPQQSVSDQSSDTHVSTGGRHRNEHESSSGQSGTDWGRHEVTSAQSQSSWRQRERQIRTIPDTQPKIVTPSTVGRNGFDGRHRRDYNNGKYTRWSNNWRHDNRYDWYDYRNRHRSNFHLGFYYDPFGWSYRNWSIGSYLHPTYFGSSYWLDDPWQYRLPPAYGPYRWVRYWNDALLVNIYTGEVVDTIHGFFW
jgi:hypothetical protein